MNVFYKTQSYRVYRSDQYLTKCSLDVFIFGRLCSFCSDCTEVDPSSFFSSLDLQSDAKEMLSQLLGINYL